MMMNLLTTALLKLKAHPAMTCILAIAIVATLISLLHPGVHAPGVIISFIVIITLSLIGIALDPKPFSLCQLFNLFCLIFMGIAPMSQYINGVIFWDMMPFAKSAYLTTNLLIIICQVAFLIIANYRRQPAPESKALDCPKISHTYLIILTLSATALTIWLFRHNVADIFTPHGYDGIQTYSSTTAIMLISYCLRSIPAICLIISLMTQRRKHTTIAITAICSLICTFPPAIPRFHLAALGIPLIVTLIPLMRKIKVLTLSILVLLFTIFPLIKTLQYPEIDVNLFFFSPDYDCYQNLLATVDTRLITHGRQLLGALLFFVPRAVWPTKPMGSGFELAYNLHTRFHDISMPIFGEGYINFGFIGAVIFTILLAIVFRHLDVRFSRHNLSFRNIIYLIILGHTIFLLRGALMPTFSALCCFALVAAVAYFPARALKK